MQSNEGNSTSLLSPSVTARQSVPGIKRACPIYFSAVLAWALQGARDYFEMSETDGLGVPPVIQAEIDAYRKEQDSIAQFIEERCETIEQARETAVIISPGDYRTSNRDLYDAYMKFCKENGEYLRSHRRLTQNMQERGFKPMNSSGRYWEGVRLLDTGSA